MSEHQGLKLRIEDAEDLTAISLHVQDAILRFTDIRRLPGLRRFALIMNRFRWETAAGRLSFKPQERIRTGLHFDYVTNVRIQGAPKDSKEEFLVLLAITFEPGEPPSGTILLSFAGNIAIALEVECIEGALIDIGEPWHTAKRPRHD